jgi:hypothetical protein
MVHQHIECWAKASGIQNAQCVAEKLAVGGGATGGWRDHLIQTQIRAFCLANEINDQKDIGNKTWIDSLEYLVQTFKQVTSHTRKCQCYRTGAQTDDVI